MKILMVCLGNFCRSPLAEGVLRKKVAEAGLSWIVESAGTNHYQSGCAPHKMSQEIALQNGIDISKHKCCPFLQNHMLTFDKIFVMDNDNYNDVKSIAGSKWNAAKVDLLLNEIYPLENRAVPDPYYLDRPAYQHVYSLIDRACTAFINKHTLLHRSEPTIALA